VGDFVYSAAMPALLIGFTVLEVLALAIYHWRTGRGVSLRNLLPAVLAGDFLMLALALILSHAFWGLVALALLASLVSHLMDLRRRWD
jgi:hypothetical protein